MSSTVTTKFGFPKKYQVKSVEQFSLFDYLCDVNSAIEPKSVEAYFEIPQNKKYNFCFEGYSIEKYVKDVGKYGLEELWIGILQYALINNENKFLTPDNFGSLYELGLAEQNKHSKKKCGQYFTPEDVCNLMARWLVNLKGDNVCDVGCGTGNLILAYLKQIGQIEAKRLLAEKKIYLYDYDKLALKIAQYSIVLTYGKEYLNSINLILGDFLDNAVKLPSNAKVISNPPYAKIVQLQNSWKKTDNLVDSKDYYSAFIEKIAVSGSRAVIISPYSFLGGSKFYSLRKVLNNYNGFIVAFDNVPGNIFNGRKHGVFNTNMANSVRAAITVIENHNNCKGFKTTPLIRFRTEERKKLINSDYLETLLSENSQIISLQKPCYIKCHKELENVFETWIGQSNNRFFNLLSKTQNNFVLHIPNTCRYFTTAATTKLNRTGVITLYAKDKESYDFLYCLINSSFAYWYWRIFDGGITYPVGLLNDIPVFENLLSVDDKKFFFETRKKMSLLEKQYIVTKLNAGVEQENVKFPSLFRKEINARFLKILDCKESPDLFNLVHSNTVFSSVEEE